MNLTRIHYFFQCSRFVVYYILKFLNTLKHDYNHSVFKNTAEPLMELRGTLGFPVTLVRKHWSRAYINLFLKGFNTNKQFEHKQKEMEHFIT